MVKDNNIWAPVRSLWNKFCGMCDEYRILKERWSYLIDTVGPALPNIEEPTFRELDNLLEKLELAFEEDFKLKRMEIEDFDEFSNSIGFKSLAKYENVRTKLEDLSVYLGLLKLAFFQRTVSLEIPQVGTGIQHSPERIIGNEIIYIAADKVAKRYWQCINSEDMRKWDSFVTFVPPAKKFYGGEFKILKNLNLFHLSLSEEQKHFVGGYLHLAHEICHIIKTTTEPLFEFIRQDALKFMKANWDKKIDEFMAMLSKSNRKNMKDTICENCPFNPINMFEYSSLGGYLFDQHTADIGAYIIGGPCTLKAFLDEDYSAKPEKLFRIKALLSLLEMEKDANNLEDIKVSYQSWLEKFAPDEILVKKRHEDIADIVKFKICKNCISETASVMGRYMYPVKKNLFPKYIKEPFTLSSEEVTKINEIKNNLVEGITCEESDPRKILHAYYEAFTEAVNSEDRPSYSATIHSLAFNKYK